MKDAQSTPRDESDRKSFWYTWPGVILGSIGIGCFVMLFGLSGTPAENRTEPVEISEQLIKAKYFDQHFEHITKIVPVENPRKRETNWKVVKRGVKSIGYFTLSVVGWVKLADRRQTSIEAVVFFEQIDGDSLTITCVKDQFMLGSYEPPESLEVMKLLGRLFESGQKIEPVGNYPCSKEDVSENRTFASIKRNWYIGESGTKTTGYFTYGVSGWMKLADKEPINDRIVVYFEKAAEKPVIITKIEGKHSYQIPK
jgi:hypothetical protein